MCILMDDSILLPVERAHQELSFDIYNEQIINTTLLFLTPFFMSRTQRSKTFSMYTKGIFLSNSVHKSV